MKSLPVMQLAKNVADAITNGHPWIFDRALRNPGSDLQAGQLVAVCRGRQFVARGFVDPESPIRVRVLELSQHVPVDARWVRAYVTKATKMRISDARLGTTNGWRLIHGENDRMPGLVVDLYDTTVVVAFDGKGARAFWQLYIDQIVASIRDAGIAVDCVWCEGRCLEGSVPDSIVVYEHAARFSVDIQRGQKTGFFLDQRDNRKLVGDLSAGNEVLNLFAYTGGFSVHAALGGARRVTSVDVSSAVIAAAQQNFVLNALEPSEHVFVATDAYEFLETAQTKQYRFDVVIVDPPSFAPSEKAKRKALRAYQRLNTAAMGVLQPAGTLVTASCSSHIDEQDMIFIVQSAGEEVGRDVRIREIRGAATDHPILPAFPEGRYLNLLVVYVG